MLTDPSPPSAHVLLVTPDEAAWETLRIAAETLEQFGVTWQRAGLEKATPGHHEAAANGWKAVIIASADHVLPAQWSRATGLPTIRIPVENDGKTGLNLLCDETGQLPAGPADAGFATMAIGTAGAKNAALFIVAALALRDEALRNQWLSFRQRQTAEVLAQPSPSVDA